MALTTQSTLGCIHNANSTMRSEDGICGQHDMPPNVGRFGRRETPRHCFRRLHPVRTGSSDPGVLSVGVRMRSGQSPLPLLRRHQREAARRVGWTKEGRRHCGAQCLGPAAMVEAGRMAAPWLGKLARQVADLPNSTAGGPLKKPSQRTDAAFQKISSVNSTANSTARRRWRNVFRVQSEIGVLPFIRRRPKRVDH